MLVGNDVVDLRDPQSQPDALHPRWDSRVFSFVELDRLKEALSPHVQRWRMWAAKESAFKVAKKIDPSLSFFPTSFHVELYDETTATVRHELERFTVRLHETVEYVHAVATREGSPFTWSKIGWAEAACAASRQAREMASRAIQRLFDTQSEVVIEPEGRIPVAFVEGVRLPIDLSLSHHGRFVAYAFGSQRPSLNHPTQAV